MIGTKNTSKNNSNQTSPFTTNKTPCVGPSEQLEFIEFWVANADPVRLNTMHSCGFNIVEMKRACKLQNKQV